MSEMDPADLERRIHEALGRIPPRRAPDTLRPRVMAAVRARASRRWYEPAWDAWPLSVRALATTAGLVVLAVFSMWFPVSLTTVGDALMETAGRAWAGVSVPLPDGVQRALELVSAARVVWRAVLGPVLFYAAVFSMVVGGVFAGCAALVTRLALGRAVA